MKKNYVYFYSCSIKKIVFFFFIFSNVLWAQQNVFSRSDSNTNLWWDGDKLPWRYTSWNSNERRPDIWPEGTRNDVFIGHNNNTSMTVNGVFFQLKTLTLQSSATSNRTYDSFQGGAISLSIGYYKYTGSGNQTFNVQIGIDGTSVDFSVGDGTTTFTNNFFLNSNTAKFDGAGNINLNGVAQGNGGQILKQGSGLLILRGANTYTGATIVNAGTLQLNREGGNTIPITNNVTVDGGTLQVSTNQTLNNLTLTSGTVIIDAGVTLTINGTITRTSGVIQGTATSNLVITGASGTIAFDQTTPGTTNVLKNLTISGSGTTTLGNALNITAGSSSGVVTVGTGATLTTGGFLTFKSDANGTASFGNSAGTISGNVTVERYIPANKRSFRFLTSAVTTTTTIKQNWQENAGTTAGLGTHITGAGGASNGFDVTSTNNPSMYTFTGGAWAAVTSTNGVLTAGTPYRLMVRGDRTIDLTTNSTTATPTTLRATGTLRTGNFSPTLNQAAGGFSFIGNPYQAPLDMRAVLTASINMNKDVLYYWDPTINNRGGYVTRTLSTSPATNNVSSSFTEILQPGQAVFVKKDNTASTATMTISETHKAVTQGVAGVFRTTSPNDYGLLRVNLQANTNNQWQTIEGSLALFNDNFSWNVTSEDATKMSNLDEEVSFVQNNTSLAIACVSAPSVTSELPIKINNMRHSNYQWQFDLTNYDGATPYLFDAQNNTYTEIADGSIVPFMADVNTVNRFKVVFQNAALSNPEYGSTIVMYPNPAKRGSSFILQGVSSHSSVVMYNTLGQTIAVSTKENEAGLQVTPIALVSTGVYIVSITSEGKTSQVKWIVE